MGFTNINYCRSTSTTFPPDVREVTVPPYGAVDVSIKSDELYCGNVINEAWQKESAENQRKMCEEIGEALVEGMREGLEESMLPFDYDERHFSLVFQCKPEVDHVIFNNPATIVFWSDGTKTVVKCQDDDEYIKETGLALCFMKKLLGNKSGRFNRELRKWCGDGSTEAGD